MLLKNQLSFWFLKQWKSLIYQLKYWMFYFNYFFKKYFYGINHKRLGLYYLYFSFFTGMSGALLATAIRFEMALPGSLFFGGDSLRYLQVITAHALIMIFFVVVPIFFGAFANFLLPAHVGSKDVAFPRLNSLGFWIQPVGYLLIAKIGFIRADFWFQQDKIKNYLLFKNTTHFKQLYYTYFDEFLFRKAPVRYYFDEKNELCIEELQSLYFPQSEILLNKDLNINQIYEFPFFSTEFWSAFSDLIWLHKEYIKSYDAVKNRLYITRLFIGEWNGVILWDFKETFTLAWKVLFNKFLYEYPEAYWFLTVASQYSKRRKRYIVKCSNPSQTVSGWTFITPFSSKLKFTGVGVQDMLILGVYYAGISTTLSICNLLLTRRTLAMPGLRNRRILLPFISISILLMLRALAVVTPVLGSAMLMLILDRHWYTTFFDFAYGGDPVFFHHLFWFFGHPEVYVLVIPAFGIINSILPMSNLRRIASKHHLIWAIYIMNYMGFLVWGHHMYLIGLDHRSRALYSTITIMISMPATIKVVNWTFTLVNGFLKKDTILLSIISFIFFFLVAGFTGMWLSHVSLNISMHDTLYVVAHFHLMLSGAVFLGIFSGFYFYFFTFFGLRYSKNLSYYHLVYYSSGQWLTFIPLFWVSFSGLPRRLHDYPLVFMGWQGMATNGHMITMCGVFAFYGLLIESLYEKKNIIIINTIVARLNKRILYYLYKIISYQILIKTYKHIPNKNVRLFINNINIIKNGF